MHGGVGVGGGGGGGGSQFVFRMFPVLSPRKVSLSDNKVISVLHGEQA